MACPLLEVKRTELAAVRASLFSQDRAIPDPDAFGRFPTIADIRGIDRTGPIMIDKRFLELMDLPTTKA